MSRINLDYGRPVFGESIACHDLMFLSVMSCFVLKSRELQLTLLPLLLLLLENLVSVQRSNCPKILLEAETFIVLLLLVCYHS